MGVTLLLLGGLDQHGDRLDLRVADGLIAETGVGLARRGEDVVDCAGGTVLPGLHDHHLHLLAMAAREWSVSCGPPAVRDAAALGAALRAAVPVERWVRGVDYDESVAGLLDRHGLDALRGDLPVRIEHRSGGVWLLNSAALDTVGANDGPDAVERDAAGRPTGRIWRGDRWLRTRLPRPARPRLDVVSRRLASFGVTGVTDATADLDPDASAALTHACRTGTLAQRVVLLGCADGPAPRKVVVADHDLPALTDLVEKLREARGPREDRPVAVHCVSRDALVLTLAALDDIGARPGDRIEHAAVVPRELLDALRRLGVTVVTQPSLIARRGDDYLARVDPDDRGGLWPFRSLLDTGVPVGCSSDAPYGDCDPWASVRAAVSRTAPSGEVVGVAESVTAWQALRGYLTDPMAPGGPVRPLCAGAAADLVVLDGRLGEFLADPDHRRVRDTIIAGRPSNEWLPGVDDG
jgi:predicted amidohydrolase YtcJ